MDALLQGAWQLAKGLALAVAVLAAALWWSRRRREQRMQELQALALSVGLAFERHRLGQTIPPSKQGRAAPPRSRSVVEGALRALSTLAPGYDSGLVVGRVDGVPVTLGPESAAGAGATATMTRLRAAIEPPLSLGLHIAARSGLDRLAFVDRLTKVPSGLPALDERVTCHARDAAGLAALLQVPGVLLALERLFADTAAATRVEDTQVVVSAAGFVHDATRWRPPLAAAVELAKVLSKASSPDSMVH